MAQAKQGSGISIVDYINAWGKVVLHNQLATPEQWSQCIQTFKLAKGQTPIEKIVVEEGLLDEPKALAVKKRVKAMLHASRQSASASPPSVPAAEKAAESKAPAAESPMPSPPPSPEPEPDDQPEDEPEDDEPLALDSGAAREADQPVAAKSGDGSSDHESPSEADTDALQPGAMAAAAAQAAEADDEDDGPLALAIDGDALEDADAQDAAAPNSDDHVETSFAPDAYTGAPTGGDEIVDMEDIFLEPTDEMLEAVLNDAPLLAPNDVREAVRGAISDGNEAEEEDGAYDLDLDEDAADNDHLSEVDWADGLIGSEDEK